MIRRENHRTARLDSLSFPLGVEFSLPTVEEGGTTLSNRTWRKGKETDWKGSVTWFCSGRTPIINLQLDGKLDLHREDASGLLLCTFSDGLGMTGKEGCCEACNGKDSVKRIAMAPHSLTIHASINTSCYIIPLAAVSTLSFPTCSCPRCTSTHTNKGT